MTKNINTVNVFIWGLKVGSLVWRNKGAYFQYDNKFLTSGLELAPLQMPLKNGAQVYHFNNLNVKTFKALPGLFADCLPDAFGGRVIESWLTRQGRALDNFSPIEHLCYMGSRAMGALEFKPAIDLKTPHGPLQLEQVVQWADQLLQNKLQLQGHMNDLSQFLQVSSSVGGMRAKAAVWINDQTNEVRAVPPDLHTAPTEIHSEPPALHATSPHQTTQADQASQTNKTIQADQAAQTTQTNQAGRTDQANQTTQRTQHNFTPWLIKLDSEKPSHYGVIEYVYYLMAKQLGIQMAASRLHEENGRRHFMTRRFDRQGHKKHHMQSLCAVAHYDFRQPVYSYEQVFQVMQQLSLTHHEKEQMFRRMVFNIVGRNQDDHTKNISFILRQGEAWQLAPAYDLIYSYNPAGLWAAQHQLSLNQKRDRFKLEDFEPLAAAHNVLNWRQIVRQTCEVFQSWPQMAQKWGVRAEKIQKIHKNLRVF